MFSCFVRSTVCCGFEIDGVGFTAILNKIGIPFVMPPVIPPLLLLRVTTLPFSSYAYWSFAWLPNISVMAKPAPNSMPFTAGMPNIMEDIRFSTPPNIGLPMPAGTPVATHSITPPVLSCDILAFSIYSLIFGSKLGSITGKLCLLRLSIRPSSIFKGLNLLSHTLPTD